ncbi:hypothetical protein NPIL_374431 [Nephila pilipes]|uniref:Uncharacterized protein n=1 Tax=Nephila pilipes TaxID=299642 RepID=A0A8X6N371_NEPPI|nr:hypothetical protein NPIL_374431 [Nephila pilipes]
MISRIKSITLKQNLRLDSQNFVAIQQQNTDTRRFSSIPGVAQQQFHKTALKRHQFSIQLKFHSTSGHWAILDVEHFLKSFSEARPKERVRGRSWIAPKISKNEPLFNDIRMPSGQKSLAQQTLLIKGRQAENAIISGRPGPFYLHNMRVLGRNKLPICGLLHKYAGAMIIRRGPSSRKIQFRFKTPYDK